jgi:hypothetical protein
MRTRAFAIVALALVTVACTDTSIRSTPTTQPPTTLTSTPVSPPGVADTVRRWVAAAAVDGQDDLVFGLLAPRSQEAVGGRAGYPARRTELRRTWGVWSGTASVAYDAVPLADGLALVVIRAPAKDGSQEAAALPMRAIGGQWRADPLGGDLTVQVTPADRAEVEVTPELSVVVPTGTTVHAFIDGHAAEVGAAARVTASTARVTYGPVRDLDPGWHLVALAFVDGDDVSGATLRYQVAETD